MAHLGDRVAAFVDGQLSDDERAAVLEHLDHCSECRSAVDQQYLLKRRMTGGEHTPSPPPSLLSSLSDPAQMCDRGRRSKLARLFGLPLMRAALALTGASVTVTAAAYVVGPAATEDEPRTVEPPVERFVAEFSQSSTSALRPVASGTASNALGLRPVGTTTTTVPRGMDSPEALDLLGGVVADADGATLELLAHNFDLSVGRQAVVHGRRAVEVVAGRDGKRAAAYWVDEQTGMLVRRVAYNRDGVPIAESGPAPEESGAGPQYVGEVQATSTTPISGSTMTSLTRSGWPCYEVLAGDLHRVEGVWTNSDDEQVVTLTYTDGISTLTLFEQHGAVDRDGLTGFEPTTVGGSRVWVRPGTPTVATWDDNGVVYTVVTDVGRQRLEDAVAELPHARPGSGVVDRVGAGLERIGEWVDPLGAA